MEKYIEQLKPVFEKVAEKIGQGAEYTWEIVLRQQIAIGVGNIVMGIGSIILGIIVYKVVRFSIKKCEEDEYSSWEVVGILFGVFGGIGSLIMIIAGFYNGILHLINPAYYALEFFIGLVK